MEMLWKLRNALGGFWDSLDDAERKTLMLYAAYLLGSLLLTVQARSRERLKQQVLEELRNGR